MEGGMLRQPPFANHPGGVKQHQATPQWVFRRYCSQRWRVPADTDPATACINDDLVIDVECDDCGPANGCQTYKTYSGCIPDKVVGPCVLTGMKNGHQFAGEWLLYSGSWPFEFITPTAGKTQVVKRGLAALCFGDDVVYHHGLASVGFGCLTISATVVIYFNQLLAEFGR